MSSYFAVILDLSSACHAPVDRIEFSLWYHWSVCIIVTNGCTIAKHLRHHSFSKNLEFNWWSADRNFMGSIIPIKNYKSKELLRCQSHGLARVNHQIWTKKSRIWKAITVRKLNPPTFEPLSTGRSSDGHCPIIQPNHVLNGRNRLFCTSIIEVPWRSFIPPKLFVSNCSFLLGILVERSCQTFLFNSLNYWNPVTNSVVQPAKSRRWVIIALSLSDC